MGGFTRGGSLLLTVPSASGRSAASYTTPPILGQSTSPLSMRVIRSVRFVPVRSPCSKLAPPSVGPRPRETERGGARLRPAPWRAADAPTARLLCAGPGTCRCAKFGTRHRIGLADGGKTAGATPLHGPDFTRDFARAAAVGHPRRPGGTGVAAASHPMTTHGTHRAGPGRGTAGRQRSFAAPARHPRIDRRAGTRGQVMVLTA